MSEADDSRPTLRVGNEPSEAPVRVQRLARCPNCSCEHAAADGNYYCPTCSARWRKWGMPDAIGDAGVRYHSGARLTSDTADNMQTNSDQPVMPAEANNSRTASDEAVVCKELLSGVKGLTDPNYHTLNIHAGRNDRLLHAVLCAYAKHHLGWDDIGWDRLGEILQASICNTIGDDAFCEWLDRVKPQDAEMAVEEDGDEIVTPMPNSCQRYGCKEHHPKLENRKGFMVCPRCGGSYGRAR